MKHTTFARTDVCGAALMAAMLAGQAAIAQSEAPAEPSRTSESEASKKSDLEQLGVVVVTAQKRSQLAKDVPSSIAVLNATALQREGASRLEDFAARVPGLSLNAQSIGQQQITIRGLSTGPGGSPTVAVYVDDAPYGSSTGDGAGGLLTPDIDPIDLQRIEVLRGPQGTLYGASNIGGLLKYVLTAPDVRLFDAEVGLEGNRLSHGGTGRAIRARANVPVVDNVLAVLVSAYDRRDAGFIDDPVRGATNVDRTRVTGARLAALWKPMDGLTLKAESVGQDRRADGFAEFDFDTATMRPLYGDFEQHRTPGADYFRSQMRQNIFTATYDLGSAQFTAVSSYSTLKDRGSDDYTLAFGPLASGFGPEFDIPTIGFAATNVIAQRKFSQEFRLSGKGSSFDWTGGIFYTREAASTGVGIPALDSVSGAPLVVPSLLDSSIDTRYREYAVYGEATYHVSPQVEFTGGLRHAKNKQHNLTRSSGLLVGDPSTVDSSSSDSSTTFTISPRYNWNDNVMTYLRVASGYRPGGSNGGYGPVSSYKPDTVVNYELGMKASLPASKLYVELSVFSIDWKDIQLQLRDSNGLSYYDNAGGARSRGIETAITYVPIRGLNIGASAALTSAELTQEIPSGQFGHKGDALPFAPKWKSSLSIDRNFQSFGWPTFVGASWFYNGKVKGAFAADEATPRIELPAYATFDLRAGMNFDVVNLSVFVKNVADKRAYNGTRALTLNGTGPTAFSLIQPRTVGVNLTASF